MNAVVKAEFDRVWLELAELRQSLNARPIAPTPDYRSDLPAEEPCSCEESERLKVELGEAQVRAQELESERDVARQGGATLRRMLTNAEAHLAAANALLRRGHNEPFLSRDEFLAWNDDVGAHLSSQPAAPTATSAHPLEFDDAVARLKEVALSHGWRLSTWGLQRDHG